MNDDHFTSPKQDTELQTRPFWALLLAIAWFALAGAMAIWPHALGPAEHPCDPDEILMCFINNSWGTPLGIVISLICGLITLWRFLMPGTRSEATVSEQQATSLGRTALSPGVTGTDTSSLSYGVRFLIATGIVILSWITAGAGLIFIIILANGANWTGRFADDILPFIILAAVAGLGGFGIIKLVGFLRPRPPPK